MPRPDKKQRHRAKRQAKRKQSRRTQSVSPIKRIADAPGDVEYFMSSNFEEFGQLQVFAYKRAAGSSALACFLIDRGVVGLKDAFLRMGLDRKALDGVIEKGGASGIAMNSVSEDKAKKYIAGAVRWTHDNGMRLPIDWVRVASLIGGVEGWESADVSMFVKEFAGHPDDLRRRLISEPFDTYIRRTDIRFIFSDSAPVMNLKTGEYEDTDDWDDDEDDEFDDDDEDDDALSSDLLPPEVIALIKRFEPVVETLTKDTQRWLIAQGRTPSPGLFEAWQGILLSGVLARVADPDASKEESIDLAAVAYAKLRSIALRTMGDAFEIATNEAFSYAQAHPQAAANALIKEFWRGGDEKKLSFSPPVMVKLRVCSGGWNVYPALLICRLARQQQQPGHRHCVGGGIPHS